MDSNERRMTEQERTDAFVTLCGGQHKADRLSRIYANSYPSRTHRLFEVRSKSGTFIRKAKHEGFTAKQANALLDLQ